MGHETQLAVVFGLIRNAEGKILLQKRIDGAIPEAHDKWELPGGKIEFGETPEQAVVRECKEETGCDIRVIRMMPYAGSNLWEESSGAHRQAIYVCYEAEWIGGAPRPLDKKVSDIQWFSRAEVLGMGGTLLPGVRELVELVK